MRIAILTPSRQRPEMLFNLFQSVNQMSSNKIGIDFFIGLDRDDPNIQTYYDYIYNMHSQRKSNIDVIAYIDQLPTIGCIWNALSRMRPWEQTADFMIMGNDDQVFKTDQWDIKLIDNLTGLDHPFYVSWVNDGINGKDHCAFPIVSKLWVSALGHFMPEIFNFFYHDTWVFDIGQKADVLNYIPDILVDHMHFSRSDGYKKDVVTDKGRADDNNKKDLQIFKENDDLRKRMSMEIKKRIELYQQQIKKQQS